MPTEAVPITVKRFRCPCCKRSWANKHATTRHIQRCWHNPETKSCKTCVYFQPFEDGYHGDPGDLGILEGCGEGVDISAGLVSNCEKWEPDQ
jgi:hypothetical protein